MSALSADRAEIDHFINAVFCHADLGGFVSLRSFEHERGKPPVEIRAQEINGEGLAPVIAKATGVANRAARHPRPTVFAPITSCTFTNDKRAAEADVHNGVALVVELDEKPTEAAARLESLLGPATAIVLSGGEWVATTGEIQAKLHLYWRLAEPTRDTAGHASLKRARALATAIVGGDASAVPLPHPLRCPGSWHRKRAPRLCRSLELRPEAEVDLGDVIEKLEQAAMLALEHVTGTAKDRLEVALGMRNRGQRQDQSSHDPDASDSDLEALADAIPNDDAQRAEWIAIGLAFFAASDGSAAGLNAWERWSRKSGKGHGGTAARWESFATSPPDRTGTGALVQRARRALPGFRLPSWGPEKQAKASAEPAADLAGERPVIRVALGGLPAAVAASNRWLAERSTAMYVLGDVLVTLEDTGAGLQTVPVTQTRIGLELARVARFERIARVTDDGPEWREVDPPLKVAAAIADEPGGWQSPRLAGLTEVPILRPNGRVVTTPGYDRPSRLFLCGGPFAPMASDPKAALAALVDALGEFPFVLPHHQSAALALMLTAVIRRQLPAAPMFGISAREAGTGKGALASLAAIMATGRRAPETPWPATADEQRKVITATLIAGQPILILDNIVGVLSGAPLCVLITAETWSDRLLGASRLVQLPASALVVATGNNLTVAGDLCRRVVPIEMDAGCESPELREFERELVPWAIENRPKLVAAALTVLAAHRKAGSPLPADFKPLGSFEAWSRTVCGALVWMGKTDPRDAMAEIRANDPKRLLLTRLLVGMETLFGRQWQSVGSILDTAKTSKERAPGLIRSNRGNHREGKG